MSLSLARWNINTAGAWFVLARAGILARMRPGLCGGHSEPWGNQRGAEPARYSACAWARELGTVARARVGVPAHGSADPRADDARAEGRLYGLSGHHRPTVGRPHWVVREDRAQLLTGLRRLASDRVRRGGIWDGKPMPSVLRVNKWKLVDWVKAWRPRNDKRLAKRRAETLARLAQVHHKRMRSPQRVGAHAEPNTSLSSHKKSTPFERACALGVSASPKPAEGLKEVLSIRKLLTPMRRQMRIDMKRKAIQREKDPTAMRVDLALFASALNLLAAVVIFVAYAATHLTAESPLTLGICSDERAVSDIRVRY